MYTLLNEVSIYDLVYTLLNEVSIYALLYTFSLGPSLYNLVYISVNDISSLDANIFIQISIRFN